VVPDAGEGEDGQGQGGGEDDPAPGVQGAPVPGPGRAEGLQGAVPHHQRQDGQQGIDEKQGLPVEPGQQQSTQGRTHGDPGGEAGGEHAQGKAPLPHRKGQGDEFGCGPQHQGGPHPLDQPAGDEQAEGGAQAAQARGRGKERHPGEEQLPGRNQVRQTAHHHLQGGIGQEIGHHDPGHRGHRGLQELGDLGQAHTHQTGVHGGHEGPQAGGEQQAVFADGGFGGAQICILSGKLSLTINENRSYDKPGGD
jgi:hypothetical protein